MSVKIAIFKNVEYSEKSAERREITNKAHELVLSSISYWYGASMSTVAVKKLESGKPIVTGARDIHISISHSGSFVVCAVSEKNVGVDIEKLRKPSNGILCKMFSENERAKFDLLKNQHAYCRAFTEEWTIKEALGKYHGTGLFGNGVIIDARYQCDRLGLYTCSRWQDEYCCTVVAEEQFQEFYTAEEYENGFIFKRI